MTTSSYLSGRVGLESKQESENDPYSHTRQPGIQEDLEHLIPYIEISIYSMMATSYVQVQSSFNIITQHANLLAF